MIEYSFGKPSTGTADKPIRRTQPFIKGPIPLNWIQKACEVNAAPLAMYLWYKWGILGATAKIKLRPARLKQFGIGEKSRQREACRLEKAGLILVTRKAGCYPVVIAKQQGLLTMPNMLTLTSSLPKNCL